MRPSFVTQRSVTGARCGSRSRPDLRVVVACVVRRARAATTRDRSLVGLVAEQRPDRRIDEADDEVAVGGHDEVVRELEHPLTLGRARSRLTSSATPSMIRRPSLSARATPRSRIHRVTPSKPWARYCPVGSPTFWPPAGRRRPTGRSRPDGRDRPTLSGRSRVSRPEELLGAGPGERADEVAVRRQLAAEQVRVESLLRCRTPSGGSRRAASAPRPAAAPACRRG